MKKLTLLLLFIFLGNDTYQNYLPIVSNFCGGAEIQTTVNGFKHHEVQLNFETVNVTEDSTNPNPFLDYNLVVKVKKNTINQRPGFYNGDVYSFRFTPSEVGTYEYCAVFKAGENVAINNVGTQLFKFYGQVDVTEIESTGFQEYGKLVYTPNRYLKHIDGPYFVKGGTNSPENFLAYSGFDNTYDLNGNFIHNYSPHGDIYGVLDYLHSVGINSIYFLPMNIGGDGQDTFPFLTPTSLFNYDVSKLNQWNDVFNYAMSKGILLTFVLAETEATNANYLGDFSVERRLFYKEMVARFGHHTVKWNIGEEQPYSIPQLIRFAEYLQTVDTYDELITFHTRNNDTQAYAAVYDEPVFNISSQQLSPWNAGAYVENLRNQTNWIIDIDEGFYVHDRGSGLSCCNADYLRKEMLYDVYFSGGNIEWYTNRDVTLENFFEYEDMWNYTRIARELVESVSFWTMQPADHLLSDESGTYGGGKVLHNINETLIYLPDASSGGKIQLSAGIYRIQVFDPVNGNLLAEDIGFTDNLIILQSYNGDKVYRITRE